MASSIEETAQYYLTPSELNAKLVSNPGFVNTGVKIGARVVNGTIVREPSGKALSFRMTDGAQEYAVHYKGIAPDTFTDGVDVVVEGRMDANGTFQGYNAARQMCVAIRECPREIQGNSWLSARSHSARVAVRPAIQSPPRGEVP